LAERAGGVETERPGAGSVPRRGAPRHDGITSSPSAAAGTRGRRSSPGEPSSGRRRPP